MARKRVRKITRKWTRRKYHIRGKKRAVKVRKTQDGKVRVRVIGHRNTTDNTYTQKGAPRGYKQGINSNPPLNEGVTLGKLPKEKPRESSLKRYGY